MNERVAKIGNQLKDAVNKLTTAWKEQEAARKRLILIIAAAVVVVAIGLVVILNVSAGRYEVLYPDMAQDEVVAAVAVLQAAGIPAKVNGSGQLEVPAKKMNQAMGQLAIQNIPSTTLGYEIIEGAGGLTTTEFEKADAWKRQQQNRLQDIIKTYTGVQNAFVTLNIKADSNAIWRPDDEKSTGSVSVTMKQGYILGSGQVNGIRNLVGAAVGIDPVDVAVLDGYGNLLAASGEGYDAASAVAEKMLERWGLEAEAEKRLIEKANNMLSLPYPDPTKYRISCTVQLDFDAMVTEIKTYNPLEGTNHGVIDEDIIDAVLGLPQYAEGVVGETDNTDVPIYVDYTGDGNADGVDFHRQRDYAVSYVLEQITKDGATIGSATMSVVVDDTANSEKMQSLRTAISGATNLAVENVSVQTFLVSPIEVEPEKPWYVNIFGDTVDPLIIYIAMAAVVAIILAMILILILRGRAKKKRLALEAEAAAAELEEAQRIQAEIEERKNQLKHAAMNEQKESAITEEVREFARANPEITANLLRNWLKEGEA